MAKPALDKALKVRHIDLVSSSVFHREHGLMALEKLGYMAATYLLQNHTDPLAIGERPYMSTCWGAYR